MIASQQTDIEKLDESVKYNLDLIKSAEDKLTTLQSEANYLERNKSTLEEQETAILAHISQLESSRIELTDEIEALKLSESNLVDRVSNLETQYEAVLADKKHSVEVLDARALQLSQAMELRVTEDTKTRESLAIWKKTLDKKDENLRIREHKIQMGESKIIQNSNLLNL